jgi:hypothetical protein
MVSSKITTIKLLIGTKKSLDGFKEYRNESYDEIVAKVLKMSRKDKLRLKEIKRKRRENGLATTKTRKRALRKRK